MYGCGPERHGLVSMVGMGQLSKMLIFRGLLLNDSVVLYFYLFMISS